MYDQKLLSGQTQSDIEKVPFLDTSEFDDIFLKINKDIIGFELFDCIEMKISKQRERKLTKKTRNAYQRIHLAEKLVKIPRLDFLKRLYFKEFRYRGVSMEVLIAP